MKQATLPIFPMPNIDLFCGDCLDVMKDIPDGSVDMVIADPPYNIDKVRAWDKWKKQEDYIEWLGSIFLECQRVLKDNGSFYFFHNDMEQIAELMLWIKKNTKFVFKQMIVWNKLFDKAKNRGFLQGFIEPDGLRNYQKMAEYCLFYTFQDETGLTTIYGDRELFKSIRDYMFAELEKSKLTKKGINQTLGSSITGGGMACHFFGDTDQWTFPTKVMYGKLQSTGYFQKPYEDLRREYEDLRREYEDLRREYEDLRYTFNNQKTNHSVWNYEIAEKRGHVTPKPVRLIENILKHSSNEGDIILDPMMGSGTTGVACRNLNRDFIGIEKDIQYFEIAQRRIES